MVCCVRPTGYSWVEGNGLEQRTRAGHQHVPLSRSTRGRGAAAQGDQENRWYDALLTQPLPFLPRLLQICSSYSNTGLNLRQEKLPNLTALSSSRAMGKCRNLSVLQLICRLFICLLDHIWLIVSVMMLHSTS